MNNVNPADPFGLAAKTRASNAAGGAPAADAGSLEAAPAAEAKQKRTYVKRGTVVADDADAELVLGYFSTGGLSIQKGKQSMVLTPSERAQLYAFMEKVE